MPTVRLFVSYSHRDPEYLGADSLLGFLKGLEKDEDVEFWTDEKIEAGTLWDEQIKERLRESDIALVLVSQSFLDSRYCTDIEMSAFLKRCRDDGMIIFPIVLSACEWDRHDWIASRQFLPGGNETIEEHYTEPGKRKRLYLKIRQELRAAIARARANRVSRELAAASASRPAPMVERRQVTILRCELVPTEANGVPVDEEDLPEILHELSGDFQQVCAQVFERFEGHIVQSSGGSVTVSFGHPTVHEDDSRRAVRAGLALIETIGNLSAKIEPELGVRLSIRAGAHTGTIVVDVANEQNLADNEAAVTAARVQELAPLGGITVTAPTQTLIDGFIETEEAGSVAAARQTFKVFRIVRDTGYDSRVQTAETLTELIGREQELALLLDRWADACASNGQAVMLQAEAGIGKSRLIAEMKARTGSDASNWVECRCSPYHQNSALFPIIGALEERLGLTPGDSNDEKLFKLEARLAPYASSLGDIVPALAALLSIAFDHKYPHPALSPREMKQLTLEVIVQLVIDRAAEHPTVFVVEDLHWIDPSTVEMLDILLEQTPTVPLLILFTYRPEYTPPQQWRSRASQITLDRLDRAGVRQMTLALTGGKTLPDEVFEEIFAKTEGFPLFVEDLTRMVIESDLVVELDDRFELAGPFQSLSIPATLQETLMARLAKLATAKPVAQVGATIGREFVFDMLREVGGFDDKTLVEELNKLVAAGLLYRRGLLSRAKYIFKHALVQEALQQSLLKKQRRQYHKLIAEVLEEKFKDVAEAQPELVGYHYHEAGDTLKAVEYWQRAAKHALAGCANREAIGHARAAIEALRELPEDEERRTLELGLRTIEGPALIALKGWAAPEVGDCYVRARELCRNLPATPKFFGVLRGIWKNHMVAARLDEALLIAGELFEIGFNNGDEDLLLEGRSALCDTLFWLGRPADAREQARLGFQLYDLDRHHVSHYVTYGEDPATMFITYSALSLAILGKPAESLEFTRGAIATLERFTHTHSRAFLLAGIAWNYVQLRDPELAGEWAQKLVDMAVENEFESWQALGGAMLAWSVAAKGNLAEGVPAFAKARAQWHGLGAGVKSLFYPALMADVHVRAGLPDEALSWIKLGFAGADACDDRYYLSELYRLEGEVLAIRGEEAKALESMQTGVAIAQNQEAKLLELRVATSMARLMIKRGEHDAAAAAIGPLLDVMSGETVLDVTEAREVFASVQVPAGGANG